MTARQLLRPTTAESAEPPCVTPRDAVLECLQAAGGQLAERQLVTEVGYGTAACRRVLGELETAGQVIRREVGRETIVSATDARPATSQESDWDAGPGRTTPRPSNPK